MIKRREKKERQEEREREREGEGRNGGREGGREERGGGEGEWKKVIFPTFSTRDEVSK